MIDGIIHILQIMLVSDLLILAVWLLEQLFSWNTGHLWRKWLWFFLCLFMIFPYQVHLSDFYHQWTGIHLEIEVSHSDVSEDRTEDVNTFELQKEKETPPANEAVQIFEPVDSQKTASLPDKEDYAAVTEEVKKQWSEASFVLTVQKLLTFIREHILTFTVIIWLAGFGAMLMHHFLQYFYIKELYLEDAVKCKDKELIRLEAFWGERYKLRKLPRLMEKEDVRTPLVFGYLDAVLVFPPEVYSVHEMSMIIQHELMHRKYLDTWYKLFLIIVCDLYWFNPVFWLMKRMAFQDVEYVCDERVTKAMMPEEIHQYGATILKTMKANPKKAIPSALQFAVNKKAVKDRLSNLFAEKNQKRGILLFLATFGVLVLCTVGIKVSISSGPESDGKFVMSEYDENHFYNQAVKHYGDYIYYSTKAGIYRTKDCETYEQVYRFRYPASTELCLNGNSLYFAECRNETSVINGESSKVYKPDTLLCMNLDTLTIEEYLTGIDLLNRIRVYNHQLYFADATGCFTGYELDEEGGLGRKVKKTDKDFLYTLTNQFETVYQKDIENGGTSVWRKYPHPLTDEGYCRTLLDGKVFTEIYQDEATQRCSLTDSQTGTEEPFGENCKSVLLTESGLYYVYRDKIYYRDHETGESQVFYEPSDLSPEDGDGFLTHNKDAVFFAIYDDDAELGTTSILQISKETGEGRELYRTKGSEYFVNAPGASAYERYLYLQNGDSQILRIDSKNRSQKVLQGGIPSKAEVAAMREAVLEGMTAEEADYLKKVISSARDKLWRAYYEDNLFGKLEDPDSGYWNYLEEKGDIFLRDNVSVSNNYNGEDFINVIRTIKSSVKSEILQKDLDILEADMKAALESHNSLYVEDLYRKLHDMDYYLLRYGPEDAWIAGIDNYDLFIYYGALEAYE